MELCSLRPGLWVLLSGALEGVIVLRISLVCFFFHATLIVPAFLIGVSFTNKQASSLSKRKEKKTITLICNFCLQCIGRYSFMDI